MVVEAPGIELASEAVWIDLTPRGFLESGARADVAPGCNRRSVLPTRDAWSPMPGRPGNGLGHASPSVTLNTYTHTLPAQADAPTEAVEAALFGPPRK